MTGDWHLDLLRRVLCPGFDRWYARQVRGLRRRPDPPPPPDRHRRMAGRYTVEPLWRRRGKGPGPDEDDPLFENVVRL